MADYSAAIEIHLPAAAAALPLLSALSRWWPPAAPAGAADLDLCYESAHPWHLGGNAAESSDLPQ